MHRAGHSPCRPEAVHHTDLRLCTVQAVHFAHLRLRIMQATCAMYRPCIVQAVRRAQLRPHVVQAMNCADPTFLGGERLTSSQKCASRTWPRACMTCRAMRICAAQHTCGRPAVEERLCSGASSWLFSSDCATYVHTHRGARPQPACAHVYSCLRSQWQR